MTQKQLCENREEAMMPGAGGAHSRLPRDDSAAKTGSQAKNSWEDKF